MEAVPSQPSLGSDSSAFPSPPPLVEWRPLDLRVVGLWRVSGLIGIGIVLLLALGPALGVGWGMLGSPGWAVLGWLILGGLLGWWIWWFPPRRHRAWGYRVDERVLELRHGVWFHVLTLLPLSRLQHVDLQRGPLERAHGLASLVLHTAGTHEATLVIPGLDAAEAARLRDLLVEAGGDDGV